MTNKKWILIAGVVALCIVIGLCAVLRSCSGGGVSDQPTGTTGTGSLTHTVTLKDEAGSPVADIGVYIYGDVTKAELVWFAKTDANGQMTFTDRPSDNYVAVLEGVPAGYLVEEHYLLTGETTEIVLKAGLMEGDLDNVTYKLGDIMLDFTVTAPNGTEYTLSELLKEYKAVVLNFWYLQCEPCKSEFPYLQEAYEQYSDDVAVLAMNPINQDNDEIEKFRKDNGYTFPMMAADPAWEKAMQLTAYPTTVVIDRHGKICMIHKGAVTETETFETMFDFYSDEEYKQTVVKNLEELNEAAGVEQVVGTKDNPVEQPSTNSFEVTVKPGQEMYYSIYRLIGARYLSIRNENAYVIYNDKTYTAKNGVVNLTISSDDASTPCLIVFGNSGDETQTYTVKLDLPPGTPDNPYSFSLDQEFTVNVPAGSEQGVSYRYYPTKDGLFTLELLESTPGVNLEIRVTSVRGDIPVQRLMSEEGTRNPATGNLTVSLNAYKGGRIDINVGTSDESGNRPAASVKLEATLEEGKFLETTTAETVTYSINITDETGAGIPGVKLVLTDSEGKNINLTTNEKGVAYTSQISTKKDAEGKTQVIAYPVMIAVPNGYRANTTEITLTKDYPSASIKFDTIAKVDYTVQVVNVNGLAIGYANVNFADPVTDTIVASATTNVNGRVTVTLAEGDYTVSVEKDGYIAESASVTTASRTAEVMLVEGTDENSQFYSVTVKDNLGNPVYNANVVFRGTNANTVVKTNASGVATKRLAKDTYTLSVNGYYVYTNATLTEESPNGNIVVIPPVKGDKDSYMDSQVYRVYEGMTYLDGLTGTTSSGGLATYDYFLFHPTESAIYKFTAFGSDAKISFWGTSTQYQADLTGDLSTVTDPMDPNYTGKYYDSTNNCFAFDVGLDTNKPPVIIGITGDTDCVILIEKIGTSLELPVDIHTYVNKHTPSTSYTVPGGTKKLLDLSQTITLTAENGYYYYNGKQVYVELAATDGRISFKDMLITHGTGFYDRYIVNSALEGYEYINQHYYKEAYEEAMIKYIEAAVENNASNGYYPLTEDLMYMLQKGGKYRGWYDPARPEDYLFKDQTVLPDNCWMYWLCTFG